MLAKGAVEDLREIVRHTNERWGEARCLAYVGQLEQTANALALNNGRFKDLSSIHPKLRVAKSGRHFIFLLPRPDALPVILAILHERMDIMARLAGRLDL